MPAGGEVEAVLITGAYGSGKSSVAAEIADVLEKRGEPYAYLDMDHLVWGYTGGDEAGAEHGMMLRNLACLVSNYLAVGVRRFVLAGFVTGRAELSDVRAQLDMPLRVVRLTLPLEEIERRLRSDVTSGRQDDLREAAAQLAVSRAAGIEDLPVANDRPIREVATEIVDWLGWR